MKRMPLGIALAAFAIPLALAGEVPPRLSDGPPGVSPMQGRFASSPSAASPEALLLPALKSADAPEAEKPPTSGPLRIGQSRKAELDSLVQRKSAERQWSRVGEHRLAVLTVSSPGAAALRVGIRLEEVPEGLSIAVGSAADWEGDGRAIVMTAAWIRETYGSAGVTVWAPVTEGDRQVVEIRVPARAEAFPAFRVEDVSHLTENPLAPSLSLKLLSCHQNYSCATDGNITQAGKAVAKISYVKGGGSYVCSGALLNDRGSTRTPWFGTANHCVATAAEAATVQFWWFYEQTCGASTTNPASTTTMGAQLPFTDASVDFTLLRATGTIPGGLLFLGWNTADLSIGESVYGIHHPAGARKAYSTGQFARAEPSYTFRGSTPSSVWNISANIVHWSAGISEGGSSGSPLLTGAGVFRGALSAGPANQTCSSDPRVTAYSRFALIYPRIRSFIDPPSSTPDEPDSAAATLVSQQSDYTTVTVNGRLNFAGDQDWYRFNLPQRGVWIVYTTAEGSNPSTDTVGRVFSSDGTTDTGVGDDDGTSRAPNFLIAAHGGPGRYYLRVTGKGPATGPYVLVSVFVPDDDHNNFFQLATPLGVNAGATGTIGYGGDSDTFAIDVASPGTLAVSSSGTTDVVGFLYDSSLRLVTSNDDAVPGVNLNFALSAAVSPGRYYLEVIGYDVDVTGPYSIQSSFSSSSSGGANFTALWWNPAEPGWGVNVNHQGGTLFATLYTYATDGAGMWLVGSGLRAQADGSYSGRLYRTTGPPYYQVPWGTVSASDVGSMTLRFSGATAGTLSYTFGGVPVTKAIQRYAFSAPVPTCTFTTASRRGATNYQDIWWNASEPGWGLVLTHQGSTIFATLYTYTNSGRDGWLVASSLVRQADGSFGGELYVPSGPPFNASPWSGVSVTTAGTMTLRFTDGETGTLTYTVLGTTVTKNIARYTFDTPAAVCN
jgi:hypothetical protein